MYLRKLNDEIFCWNKHTSISPLTILEVSCFNRNTRYFSQSYPQFFKSSIFGLALANTSFKEYLLLWKNKHHICFFLFVVFGVVFLALQKNVSLHCKTVLSVLLKMREWKLHSSATPALPPTFCLRSVFPTCPRESHKNRCSAEPTFIPASPFHEGGEVQISKETCFRGGSLMAHWFVDSLISNKRQRDIPAHWIIKWTQDQSIGSRSSFTVELTCHLVLFFVFYQRTSQ